MASYDSNPPALYDSGITYDSQPAPPAKRKIMIRIKRTWTRMNRGERVDFAQTIKAALTGNPNVPNPTPPLAELTAAITLAQTKRDSVAALETQLATARAAEAAAQDALVTVLDKEAAYCESLLGDNPAGMASTGFPTSSGPSAPQEVGQVTNFSLTASDEDGALEGQWDPVPGAHSYEAQSCADPSQPNSWSYRGTVTASSFRYGNLVSGSRCWFRVRAIGSKGPGPWSDPATKIVP